MKRLLIAAGALALGCSLAHATQKTPTAVKTEVNAGIIPGIPGGITALSLNLIMNDVVDSYGGTLVSNTWTQAQTFHVSPIVETLTGYVYCNGLSACTASTNVPVGNISSLGTGVATFLSTPSSANLATAVTDETGSGSLVFGTSPTISAPTISGHPTVEGVTSTGATGLGKFVFDASPTITTPTINGVTDASSAGLGVVGQTVENHATGVAYTAGAAAINLVTLSLPAGDWDIHATGQYANASATAITMSLNTTSATHNNTAAAGGFPWATSQTSTSFAPTLYWHLTVNASTNVYLVLSAAGTTSQNGQGSIVARRIR